VRVDEKTKLLLRSYEVTPEPGIPDAVARELEHVSLEPTNAAKARAGNEDIGKVIVDWLISPREKEECAVAVLTKFVGMFPAELQKLTSEQVTLFEMGN